LQVNLLGKLQPWGVTRLRNNIRTIGRTAGAPEYAQGTAAMDATGLETSTASAHFQSRSGRPRRKWVKGLDHHFVRQLAALESGLGLVALS